MTPDDFVHVVSVGILIGAFSVPILYRHFKPKPAKRRPNYPYNWQRDSGLLSQFIDEGGADDQ